MRKDDGSIKSGLIEGPRGPYFGWFGWKQQSTLIRKLDLKKKRDFDKDHDVLTATLHCATIGCSHTSMATEAGSSTFLREASTCTERAREDTNLKKSSRLQLWGSSNSAPHSFTASRSLRDRSEQSWT